MPKSECGSDILFILTVEDAQIAAHEMIGRYLNDDEMHMVRKGVEAGLGCWSDVMRVAIRAAVR